MGTALGDRQRSACISLESNLVFSVTGSRRREGEHPGNEVVTVVEHHDPSPPSFICHHLLWSSFHKIVEKQNQSNHRYMGNH